MKTSVKINSAQAATFMTYTPTLIIVLCHLEAEASRRETFALRPARLCYSSSGEKNVYYWGQGPRHMFTAALRRAIVAKGQPVHAEATPKIISEQASRPWTQRSLI